MTDEEYDTATARLWARPEGAAVLAEMDRRWAVVCAPMIRAVIAKERRRWSTGGSVSDAGGSRDS